MSSTLNNTVSHSKNTGIALDNTQYQILDSLTDDEYESLKSDIRENGVNVPVVIDEQGAVIDGHHRVKACRELNIDDYPTRVKDGLSELEKRALARSLNAQRRQMDDGDKRDLIEQSLLDYDDHDEHRTDKELATECGTSQSWVNDVRHELVKNGQITTSGYLTQSAQRARISSAIDDDPDESDYSIGKRLNVSKNTVASVRREKESEEVDIDDIDVIHDDFREVDIEPESIDHIVTDPPYAEEHLPLWSDLSELADRVLKPGGFVVAYTGKAHLPKVQNLLGEQLEYHWQTIINYAQSGRLMYSKGIESNHRTVLIYAKPPIEKLDDVVSDVVEGNGPEKVYHEWQQSVEDFGEFLDRFTGKGDRILDPMVGTGTTLIACLENDREAVGIEKNEDMINIINERLEEIA